SCVRLHVPPYARSQYRLTVISPPFEGRKAVGFTPVSPCDNFVTGWGDVHYMPFNRAALAMVVFPAFGLTATNGDLRLVDTVMRGDKASLRAMIQQKADVNVAQ